MRLKAGMVALAALSLSSCGGEGGGGGGTGSVPTPTPSPAPSPSGPSYPTYASLSGNQTFRTACAGLRYDYTPPLSLPATRFGSSVTLSYDATAQGHAVTSDSSGFLGAGVSFTAADANPAVTAPAIGYRKTVNGFIEQLSIGYPTALGVVPDYVRGLSLRAPLYGDARSVGSPAVQYSCVFGVPTLASDLPAGTQVAFTRTSLNGSALLMGRSGAPESYSLAPSVVSVTLDLVARKVRTSIQLKGYLLSASGTATTITELGSFSGEAAIDAAGFYVGDLATTDRVNDQSSFGGWFFGPQAREAGFSVTITGGDNATGRSMAITGNVIALR